MQSISAAVVKHEVQQLALIDLFGAWLCGSGFFRNVLERYMRDGSACPGPSAHVLHGQSEAVSVGRAGGAHTTADL